MCCSTMIVAGEPGPVDPVPNHVFHVGPAGLADAVPQRALIPDGAHRSDVADRAVAYPLVDFHAGQLAAELGAGHDAQTEARCLLGGLHHGRRARDVDGDRLFHEEVLARVHDRGHVHRAEVRGRRVEHDVDARVEELLVAVEAREAFRLGDVLAALLHQASGLFQAILEDVGERDDLEVGPGVEEVGGGAAAAAAAADQSSSEERPVRSAWRRAGLRSRRRCLRPEPRPRSRDHRGGSRRRDRADELATADVRLVTLHELAPLAEM